MQLLNISLSVWDLIIKGGGVAATLTAACLVYYFTKRNMRNETRERLTRYRKEKLMDAGMGFWSLLAYTTEVENSHSVLVWEKEKGSQELHWYIIPDNARNFMNQLNEVNYEKGFGLFLDKPVRDLFYEYRNHLHKILYAEKQNTAARIPLQNPELVQRLQALHREAIAALRRAMELEKPGLTG
jgi:hypothetical protein